MTEETLFTLDEAAKALKVSIQTVRRMIKSGELSAVKVRGQLRVRKASLEKYL